jgi:hypothetical protein
MIVLKIAQTESGPAILLSEEVQALLGVAPGGEVRIEVTDDGRVALVGPDMSFEARRERGRAFIAKYRKTFEALAK